MIIETTLYIGDLKSESPEIVGLSIEEIRRQANKNVFVTAYLNENDRTAKLFTELLGNFTRDYSISKEEFSDQLYQALKEGEASNWNDCSKFFGLIEDMAKRSRLADEKKKEESETSEFEIIIPDTPESPVSKKSTKKELKKEIKRLRKRLALYED